MRKMRKKYKTPKKMWDKERIETEKGIVKEFGLKKKREIWRAQTVLRKYRRLARGLAATKDKKVEKELTEKLSKLGILEKNAGLDDVLGLVVEDILNRRLQTVVHKLGLAHTAKQARQLITHGKIAIAGKRVVYPSYMVSKDEEKEIKVLTKVSKAEVKAEAKQETAQVSA
jgi:small subunit ribosomal protein S4